MNAVSNVADAEHALRSVGRSCLVRVCVMLCAHWPGRVVGSGWRLCVLRGMRWHWRSICTAHDCFVRRLPRALDGQGFPSPGSEPGDLEVFVIAHRSTFSEKTLFLITY